MGRIRIEKNIGGIEGLCVVVPDVHIDERGYFIETYNKKDMEAAGLSAIFVQDNQSGSKKGVLRGLHFHEKYPEGKLIRVIRGAVFDVAVDLRKNSITYGRWSGIELTEKNRKQFYIPKGFAHGFLVLSDFAELSYKCTGYYRPEDEKGIAWNDPTIGIEWPLVVGTYRGTASPVGYFMEDGTAIQLNIRDQKWGLLSEL
ncbi:MAG: dTDP-4-dehydrorhamnose 3,5-epimerase [Mediterraneibacter sp.]